MATVNVTFFSEYIKNSVAVVGEIVASEDITTSGTSAATTAASNGATLCRVVALGGNVRLAFGSSPTATATDSFLLLENDVAYFRLEDGFKVAAIDN